MRKFYYGLESYLKSNVIHQKMYYVIRYSWTQYAEGITGYNRSLFVETNNTIGFEKKEATALKNKFKKETSLRNKQNTKGKNDYGAGIAGACGGYFQAVRGDKLIEALDKLKKELNYFHLTERLIGDDE